MRKFINLISLLLFVITANWSHASELEETLTIIETRKIAMQGIWYRIKRLSPYVELKEKVDYNKELATLEA